MSLPSLLGRNAAQSSMGTSSAQEAELMWRSQTGGQEFVSTSSSSPCSLLKSMVAFSFYNTVFWKSVVGATDFPNNPKMDFHLGTSAEGQDGGCALWQMPCCGLYGDGDGTVTMATLERTGCCRGKALSTNPQTHPGNSYWRLHPGRPGDRSLRKTSHRCAGKSPPRAPAGRDPQRRWTLCLFAPPRASTSRGWRCSAS